MKTTHRIFNFTDLLGLFFSKQNWETFDISHAFLLLQSYQLSNTVWFLAYPVRMLHGSEYTLQRPNMLHEVEMSHDQSACITEATEVTFCLTWDLLRVPGTSHIHAGRATPVKNFRCSLPKVPN